jgi:hypothetical protein
VYLVFLLCWRLARREVPPWKLREGSGSKGLPVAGEVELQVKMLLRDLLVQATVALSGVVPSLEASSWRFCWSGWCVSSSLLFYGVVAP